MRRRQFLAGGAALAACAGLARPSLAATPASTLRFVPQADLSSLDPVWTTATVAFNHGMMVYDTLYGIDASFRPQPQLAEGHVVEDDGKRWVFTLRDGPLFHDGEKVRAQDAVASIKRWMPRDTHGQTLALRLDEIRVLDDRRFEIRLKRPFGLMLDALGKALDKPQRPMVAIVAGSKVSTKLDVLTSLADICDQLIVGGGIANTFLAAAGYKVGKSLHEADLIDTAKAIAAKVAVPLPVDVVVAKEFAESAEATVKAIADVADDDMILDIGPKTAAMFGEMLKASQTILWNGPVGVFEFDQFGNGTKVLAQAIAQSPAFSIAGGGDTLAAIDKYGVAEQISYISTGGGAFLEFVEGKVLPAVEVLEQRAS